MNCISQVPRDWRYCFRCPETTLGRPEATLGRPEATLRQHSGALRQHADTLRQHSDAPRQQSGALRRHSDVALLQLMVLRCKTLCVRKYVHHTQPQHTKHSSINTAVAPQRHVPMTDDPALSASLCEALSTALKP
jgi:hypothetical protein